MDEVSEITTLNKEDLVNKLLNEADIEKMEEKGWIGSDKSFREISGHFNDIFLETIFEDDISNFWDAIVNGATKRYMESLPIKKEEETKEEIMDLKSDLGDNMENKTLKEVKEGIQKRMDVATEKLLEIIDKNYEAILTEEDDHVVEWFRYDLENWIGEKELIALLRQGAEIKNLKMKKSRENLIKELIKWLRKDDFSADSIGNILITIESKNRDSFKWGYFDKVIINEKCDDKVLIKVIADEIIVFDVVSFLKYEIEHPHFIKNNEEIKEYIKVAKEAYNNQCEYNE